jgi:5-methyltetrahydropteroyltriglutamate--homocysteine methyltransferase
MARTHVLGFPRIGAQRELESALEAFWQGGSSDDGALRGVASGLRRCHASLQRQAGLDTVVVGDFAWYDHMLGTCALLGALPARFGFDAKTLTLARYFEMARGNAAQPALEMARWFDTRYHHLVPELGPDTPFDGGTSWFLDEVEEALALGPAVKPVLVGPLTFLWLSKTEVAGFDRLSLLPRVMAAYRRVLERLASRGIEWVQLDEPALCLDLPDAWLEACRPVYDGLAGTGVKLLLATYFDTAADKAPLVATLPVQGVHIDLVRAPGQLDAWCDALPGDAVLSVGVVDGRNVWRNDLSRTLALLEPLHARLGDRLWLAPSCSLLHVPVSLASEDTLDAEVRSWLAFATEKLGELATLGRALASGRGSVAAELVASDAAQASRRASGRVVNELVQRRVAAVTPAMAERQSHFPVRIERQRLALKLPPLPTTTVGPFPRTAAIRQARVAFERGELGALDHLQHVRAEIELAVRRQEALGLDVLVHGEAERDDRVAYFGERLWGFALSDNGWVQSHGPRCVKPPLLYGDVYRPEPMTVETARHAQSLTDRPMKGLLTGPVTLLQSSFVRDDQPRETTALQLALAIRDEVADLEQAGIHVIQIDEPAFREGLPLRRSDWAGHLEWAVRAFRISAGSAADETQIHNHLCPAGIDDILPSITAMDADVTTLEASRSAMARLDGFAGLSCPNEIGPGVFESCSPKVPSVQAIQGLLERVCEVIPPQRLWVNPGGGLTTRGWAETEEALSHMVEAARALRRKLGLVRATVD